MIIEIRLRKGDSLEWAVKNPILAPGEPGYETDTNKLKVGDGYTVWNSLPYTTSSGGSSGPTGQVYYQDSPAGSWVISGTLGRIPNVAVYVDGELVDTDVFADSSTVTISFPSPTAGVAVLT